jgi:hypothetical protein
MRKRSQTRLRISWQELNASMPSAKETAGRSFLSIALLADQCRLPAQNREAEL